MRGTAAPPQSRWPRSGWSGVVLVVLVVRDRYPLERLVMAGDRGVVPSARPGGPWPGRERFVLQDVVPAPESPANNDILAYKAAVAALRTAVAGPGGRQSR